MMTIEPDGQAMIATDFSDIDLGGESVLLVRTRDGATTIVDRMEAELLKTLRRPSTIDEIPSLLKALRWEAIDSSWIAETLGSLEAAGWLGSLHDRIRSTVEAGTGHPSGEEASGLRALSWPTRDRPAALERGLEAWQMVLEANCESLPDAIIADDSTKEAAATRRVVERFAEAYKGSTYLLDGAFRGRLAAVLSDVEAESARFALDPVALRNPGVLRYGANRNLILLASAGRTVAMADDDILPEFRTRPDADGGLALMPGSDPSLFRSFIREADADSYGVESTSSALTSHGVLGRRASELIGAAEFVACGGLDAASLDRVLDPDARIAAISFGVWGDSGMGNSRFLLGARERLDPDSFAQATYADLAASRILFRAPRRLSLGGGFFMGDHVSFDLTQLLPPFSPLGRCEDSLWAACLARIRPDLLVANPREAVRHAPAEKRVTERREVLGFIVRCNEVLAALLPHPDAAGSAAETFRVVGASLCAVGASPLPKFRRWVSERYGHHLSLLIERMEALRSAFGGEAEDWDEDITIATDDLRALAARPLCWLPEEFTDDEEGFRLYLRRFGLLLEAWPAFMERAKLIVPELLEGARVCS